MHIAEVTATNQWQKLEDLIKQKVSSFAFENGIEYTIQNIGISDVKFIEKSSTSTNEVGFIKRASEIPIVYTKTSGDLYVKSRDVGYLTVSDED